jgi:hypothetical protein
MRKLFYLALLLFLFSCKEDKKSTHELRDSSNKRDKLVGIDTLHLYDKALKIDTLVFEKLKSLNVLEKVLAVSLKTGFSKDSIQINSCRLDFYFKNKLIQSIPVDTYASSEDPIWSIYEDVFMNDTTKNSDSRFFEISYGVGACGYVQSNFLFFVDNNLIQLVSKYDSVGDGPYGSYVAFNPNFVSNEVVSFTSKKVVIDTDESKPYNDENENFVITFYDSTIYTFNFGKWSGQLKSVKDKPFRKEFKTYKELYPSE